MGFLVTSCSAFGVLEETRSIWPGCWPCPWEKEIALCNLGSMPTTSVFQKHISMFSEQKTPPRVPGSLGCNQLGGYRHPWPLEKRPQSFPPLFPSPLLSMLGLCPLLSHGSSRAPRPGPAASPASKLVMPHLLLIPPHSSWLLWGVEEGGGAHIPPLQASAVQIKELC